MPTQTELPFDIFATTRPLSPKAFAERLGCTERHIYNLIETGELAAINIGSGEKAYWRIPAEAVRDFGLRVSSLPLSHQLNPIRTLPRASLLKLYFELKTHLKQ